jgi:hypothetical protein
MATKSKIAEATRISVKDAPRRSRPSNSFHALVLGVVLLISGPFAASLRAQDGGPPYPGGSDLSFEWDYSCPTGKDCSFSCPGSGGASHVTNLSIYLGTIPLGSTEHAASVFYKFSTVEISRANGFSISTGIGALSCQVNGMKLDYSGPPKSTADVSK